MTVENREYALLDPDFATGTPFY